MLQFFRKYQKIFFVIVTFFIVVSFSFFGTFRAFSGREKVQDREIGQLVDGSVLKEQKLHGLMRLLQFGIEEGGRTTNLLNDSVVHKDIILSGLGEILAEHFFDELEPDLAEKWQRVKNYSSYVHPFAPHISAKAVWGQMAPQIIVLLEKVGEAPAEFSKEQLPLLFQLYAAQADFPPPLLLQMLYYQQMQGNQVRPDPGLPTANVGLFGFQSIDDWFGQKFVEGIGKFILNAACIAREEGYVVKKEEAQVDLMRNVYFALKMFQQEKTPTNEETHNAFVSQTRHLGLSEGGAVNYWSEVLLFRRLFHEVGESVFLDRLALDQFKRFATPSQQICRYQLPRDLMFIDFREMLKFQRYIEVAFEGDSILDLPKDRRDPEAVRDAFPQLCYKPFKVEIVSVTVDGVAAGVSLKQTWDWEGEEENFARLQEEFPALANGDSMEERIQALDDLDERTRFQVDQFARRALVRIHPEWIDEALARAAIEERTLKVRLQGGEMPFSGEHFLALLETEDPSLVKYSTDEETYCSIHVVEKGQGWHLLTFEEANRDDTLEEMLDTLLITAYAELEFEEPYEEMRDEMGAKIYKDLLRLIALEFDEENFEDFDGYARYRFDGFLKQMRTLAINDPEGFAKLQEDSLWALEQRTEVLPDEGMSIAVGEFSPIFNNQFYQLIEKEEVSASQTEIAEVKEHLNRDAQQKLMRRLLQRI